MIFSFKRDQASIDGSTTLELETSPNLADWPNSFPVPDSPASNNPGVSVIKDDPPGYDTVTLILPASQLCGTWLFTRPGD